MKQIEASQSAFSLSTIPRSCGSCCRACCRPTRKSRSSARPPIRIIARERIKALNPDVVTLDVEMPHMDGAHLPAQDHDAAADAGGDDFHADPGGAETTLEALEIGAVDFVAKPTQ